MTHSSAAEQIPPPVEPGRQMAQLRDVLTLVEQIAGRNSKDWSEEGAGPAAAYEDALPVKQRRFEALAAETATWAAAGLEALLAIQHAPEPPRAAAAALAAELDRALADLDRLLRA